MFVQVIGQVGERVQTDTFEDPLGQVQVNIYRVPFFGVESLPNGRGNANFDAHLINGRLETLATDNSNVLRFFKQSCKPLAIKAKNVEEAEEKELISLFDEEPFPKKTQETSTEIKPEEKPVPAVPAEPQTVVLPPPPSQPLEPI
jgi:hypothetical protein